MNPTLELKSLVVEIPTRKGLIYPVDQVSLTIEPGEILGIVGESGAGKSMLGNAIIGLLNRPARISEGEVLLKGRAINNLDGEASRKVRGKEIGMIFQDPLTSLNPLLTIGQQLTETILAHLPVSMEEARERAIAGLDEVGIPAAKERLDAYPHQFSGGMRQRVVIALALCAEPDLIIADEPTTALDVSVQAQIIALLKRLCAERKTSVMLITHDMGVIAETANRVGVMYAGRLAEIGTVRDVLTNPQHPYSDGLIRSTPRAKANERRLHQIPGSMPRLEKLPIGCAFHPRCPYAQDKCKALPKPKAENGVACWYPLSKTEETS